MKYSIIILILVIVSGCITGNVDETTTTLSYEQTKSMEYRNCMEKCNEYSTCMHYYSEEECDYIREDCVNCMNELTVKYG